MPRMLLLSNSRGADGVMLGWARDHLREFMGSTISTALFVPYAGVPGTRATYDAYASRVRGAFDGLGCRLRSIHEEPDPAGAVRACEAVVIGGGNTFQLLAEVYRNGIREALAQRVREGASLIGWSAGSNLACPGIWTTNDMPIAEPPSLKALGLIPFQINPHFTDAHPPGHQGETRSERIAEFLALWPDVPVVGLREGALLHVEGGATRLHGTGARIFRAGRAPWDASDGAELTLTA